MNKDIESPICINKESDFIENSEKELIMLTGNTICTSITTCNGGSKATVLRNESEGGNLNAAELERSDIGCLKSTLLMSLK